MATSNIPKTRIIQYKTVNLGDVTVGAVGYLNVASYKPADMTNFLLCLVGGFGAATPAGAFTVTSDGTYVIAAPNTTITNLRLRYYFTN